MYSYIHKYIKLNAYLLSSVWEHLLIEFHNNILKKKMYIIYTKKWKMVLYIYIYLNLQYYLACFYKKVALCS